MCKWGTDKKARVTIPAYSSHTKKERKATKPVDACLHRLIKTLNSYGIQTIACCCGHGKTKKSYVIIHPKNVHFGILEEVGAMTIHLQFPYQGKK